MAKKETTKASPSFDDYSAESLLSSTETEEVETDNEETDENEEQEEVIEKPKAKATEKKVEKVEKKIETIKTQEEEDESKTPDAIKGKTEEADKEGEEESDPLKFFEEVEKVTGRAVEVDYGDVDPLSPQGVALRESAVVEQALDSWLEEMENNFPTVFRALKHANNGGDPAELFTQTTTRDYSKVALKEGDDALAKQILTEYYQAKGVKNPAKLAQLLETDEDSTGGLVGEASAALKELQTEQEEQRNKVLEEQERKAAEQKKKDTLLITAVDEVLESRQLGDFKIADRNEAGQFRQYVLQNIRKTTDGKYEIATPLDDRNLTKQLQFQYFQFKQGDLSKIIQQKVGTEKAKDLRLRLKGEQEKKKTTTTSENITGNAPSLQDY